jgi:hypothetical protein
MFELWELETGNLIADYPSVEAALEFVRAAVREHDPRYVLSWELARVTEGESAETVCSGEQLIQRALKGIAA